MSGITAVLNLHHEGLLAHSSLTSIRQARRIAEATGVAVEILAVADCPDAATLDYLSAAEDVRVVVTDVDDLGMARNVGVAEARGDFVAFLDGDDLWGPNWLKAAYEASQEGSSVVWHPEVNLYFGSKEAPWWLLHPDIEAAEGDWVTLGMRNHWTSLSFGARDIYRQIPYPRTDLKAGFGYEDWSWNCEVVAQGYMHRPVSGTTHLIRMKETSLMRRTTGARALMTPSSLLRRRIGWAARVGSFGVAARTDRP